ncbi:MAG TPA: four helix bundle protein [Pirellulales bacterium]|nr:four helix bundle protein [Pirellulales bacterium]
MKTIEGAVMKVQGEDEPRSIQEQPRDLRERTKALALRIIRMFTALPKSSVAQVIGNQVLRARTSVGAHYREAVRARSPRLHPSSFILQT